MEYQILVWERFKESIRLARTDEERFDLIRKAKSHYFYVLQIFKVDLYELCGGLE